MAQKTFLAEERVLQVQQSHADAAPASADASFAGAEDMSGMPLRLSAEAPCCDSHAWQPLTERKVTARNIL